jgi:hypothetical protein
MSALNSGVVTLEDCISTRVMKWADCCEAGLKGREVNRTDQQFCSVVTDFRAKMKQKFYNFLSDYTEVSNLSKSLTSISLALKI